MLPLVPELQVTVGGIIAVPAVPAVGKPVQDNVGVTGAALTTSGPPVQVTAARLLQSPEAAFAFMLLYVVASVGLAQVGASVQVTLATVVSPHLTVGRGVIATPTVPVVGTPVQVSVGVAAASVIVIEPHGAGGKPLQRDEDVSNIDAVIV
jgi:hypothetical protein